MKKILIYNREKKSLEEEKIYGQKILEYLYTKKLGLFFTKSLLKRKFFSKVYGNQLKTKFSKRKILDFIEKNSIDTSEFLDDVNSFKSFNDFFIRKLKPEARPIAMDKDILISIADSRLSVFKIQHDIVIPVKGRYFTLEQITNNSLLIKKYLNGLCLIFRLAPIDYHRFCYLDNGIQKEIIKLGKFYNSVHPIALESNLPIFQSNYREYCEIETENFGDVLHIDIGALGVSKIVQHYPNGKKCFKGEEKGYFEFGGSTSILVFCKDTVEIDKDILEYSKQGIEVLVKYGSAIGRKLS
ncbi:MAG: phosphatidylserine decarboxylase proenzyme [Candidatus Sericytochromatia bacterium]|nr:MAG: phosphatidylserine decarboxylase proenzyme [Candidatus Sericytochromatia bacterium]